MAKFYVTSGTFHEIVQSDDAHTAALWAMHLAMEQIVPLDDLEWLSQDQKEDLGLGDGLLALDRKISVSEVGFGHDDSGVFESIEILTEWNQLVMAVSRMESLFENDRPSDSDGHNRITDREADPQNPTLPLVAVSASCMEVPFDV